MATIPSKKGNMTKKARETQELIKKAKRIFDREFYSEFTIANLASYTKETTFSLIQRRERIHAIFIENIEFSHAFSTEKKQEKVAYELAQHWEVKLEGQTILDDLDEIIMRLQKHQKTLDETLEQEAKEHEQLFHNIAKTPVAQFTPGVGKLCTSSEDNNDTGNLGLSIHQKASEPPPASDASNLPKSQPMQSQPMYSQTFAQQASQPISQAAGTFTPFRPGVQQTFQPRNINVGFGASQHQIGQGIGQNSFNNYYAQPQQQYVPQVRLPTVPLQEFYGEIHNFEQFISIFDLAVHNNMQFNELDKLITLKSLLKGDAGLIIRNIPLTPGMYEHAYELVRKRYANALTTRSSLIRELERIPVANNNPRSLRRTLDTINSHFTALSTFDKSIKTCSLTVEAIKSKFPQKIKTVLIRKELRNECAFEMKDILSELEDIVAEEEDVALSLGNSYGSDGET